MKIALSELDEFLLDPEAWAAKKLAQGGSPRMSYTHLTRMGVFKFHKTSDAKTARNSLIKYLDSFHLSNADRRAQAEDQLNSYMNWAAAFNPTVIQVAPSIRVELGSGLYTSGQVHRVDMDLGSGGYRAVMLATNMTSASDPRAAVIQHGYAELSGRDAALVCPSHQNLDGTALVAVPVSPRRINKVMAELRDAARLAAAVFARGR